ncbi:MAG TPA: integrase core domain-containing protein [Gemmataceae bacterium]|nr:integrase core domain-containing protein [Gemmataceae bacterium]
MHLLGVPSSVYRLGSYSLRQEALEGEIALRHKLLGDWERLKRFNLPDAEIARITGVSRATFYRRKRAIAMHGTQGLERRSRRPKRVRQSAIPQSVRELVLQLRRRHPTYGKAKLTVILARDHGIALSESTIGRILRALMDQGLLRKHTANRWTKRRRFSHHAQRWKYGMARSQPGDLIQIDHMSVSKNQLPFKHFQAWDPLTKYTYADVYAKAKSASAAAFLETLQQALPFPVRSIQVDGGSEFMKDFEQACQTKGIPLYVLPPKRPQYNGGVERMNRTMREDLYARQDLLADSITGIREAVKKATHIYNHYRPHQALDNLTPAQYVARLQEAI